MFWGRSSKCCQSTSTSTFSSRSESYLRLGKTADNDKGLCNGIQRQQSDKSHSFCPPKSYHIIRRDLKPVRKESKHRIEIKIIDQKKPKKTEEHKLIHIVPSKPRTSGVVDLAEKAVSALSTCLSYIFPTNNATEEVSQMTVGKTEQITETKNFIDTEEAEQENNKIHTSSEVTLSKVVEEFHQQDDRVESQPTSHLPVVNVQEGSQRKQMDDLIAKFKSEALEVDDEMFEKLFEKLKNELDKLSCECAHTTPFLEDPSPKSQFDETNRDNQEENVEKFMRLPEIGHDNTKDDYLSLQEMRDMFAELKLLLEKNFSVNNDRRNDEKLDKILKTSTDIGIITSCLENIKVQCECEKSKLEKEIPKSENETKEENTDDNIPSNMIELYDKITSKMNEIACQCDKTHSSVHIRNNDFADGHQRSLQSNSSLNISDSKQSPSFLLHDTDSISVPENMQNEAEIEKSLKREEKLTESNGIPAHLQSSRDFIPLEQFVNLANELKEAVYTSSCKCSEKKTEPSHSEEEINSNSFLRDDRKSLSLIEEAPQDYFSSSASQPNEQKLTKSEIYSDQVILSRDPPFFPLTLLERAVEEPMNISDLFEKPTYQLYFPTVAESPVDSFYSAECSNGQTMSTVIDKKEEAVGVNTPCRCFVDQVVQTIEGMKVSYGVFCDGQLPAEELNQQDMSDVEITRKMSQEGDVEKIRVKIRLKDGVVDVESEEATVPGIGKSRKFFESFGGYDIKYETTQNYIDRPKVVKAGNQIKIFIPLDICETIMKDHIDEKEKGGFSLDSNA